ncbi:MAG: sigma 54-interacting transcriptional regulator [Planctomycetota bacterium]
MTLEAPREYAEIARYVAWSDDDARRVNAAAATVLAAADELVADFYAEIGRHPAAMAVIGGGEVQISRLKSSLRVWLRQLMEGPYDHDYVVLRSNVGRRHVAVGLDHRYAAAALARLRVGLQRVIVRGWEGGAVDLAATLMSVNKRVDLDGAIIQKAYEEEYLAKHRSLSKENLQLRVALDRSTPSAEMIGEAPAMQAVYRLIDRAGPTDRPILIQGETGAGKELVARALHRSSGVSDRPLVTINCAALPEQLLESELFGHEKGAFTGAVANKPGLFEVADGGTLFVDEIGELAPSLQAKLLRVLEDGVLRRVGSVKEQRVSVRLICATNRDLAEEVAANRFREDLYYRINVLRIQLPPLRERGGDLRLLVDHFLGEEWRVSPECVEVLENYGWPGNVRQLQNALERAKILADDGLLLPEHLPPEIVLAARQAPVAAASEQDLESVNREHVAATLERCGGNKSLAARKLGVSRRSLYRLLDRYGLSDS